MWAAGANAVLTGKGKSRVLRACGCRVACAAIERTKAARPTMCCAALAAARSALKRLTTARRLFVRDPLAAHWCCQVQHRQLGPADGLELWERCANGLNGV